MTERKPRIPYFPFYADDFLVGTMAMSDRQRGVYITLLCLQFANANRIAIALPKLCQLCDSDHATVSEVLESKFVREADYWVNKRLAREYDEAASKRESAVKAAKTAAGARWNKAKEAKKEACVTHCDRISDRNANQNQNQNQKDLSKDKSKEERGKAASRPSLEQVRDYCQERNNSVDPEQFHDHYTANGWKQSSGNAIRDWRAAVRTWERNNISGTRAKKEIF